MLCRIEKIHYSVVHKCLYLFIYFNAISESHLLVLAVKLQKWGYWHQRADKRLGNLPPKVHPWAFSGQRQGWKTPKWTPLSHLCVYSGSALFGDLGINRSMVVPGVSHIKKCDWLVKNMTDWRLEVDLGQLNDWRRLAVSMTGGSDFASALLFVTVCASYAVHDIVSGPTAPITCSEYSFFVLVLKLMYYL